jgi:hypothetical protein
VVGKASHVAFVVVAALSWGGRRVARATLINGTGYRSASWRCPSDFSMWTPNVLRPPPIKPGDAGGHLCPTTYCQADEDRLRRQWRAGDLAEPEPLHADQDQARVRSRERHHHGALRRLGFK